MENLGHGSVASRHERPDYTRKDFNRAAEDLQSCPTGALEFFPKFDLEFTNETKDIKKYSDAQLLNAIWEREVQRFENAPRDTGSTTATNDSRNNQASLGNEDARDSNSRAAGIESL